MPTIAWFYGIAIRMYVKDYPPPHAVYGEHEAFMDIVSGEIIRGHLPKAAARLVKDWTLIRQTQLIEELATRRCRRAARKDTRSRW